MGDILQRPPKSQQFPRRRVVDRAPVAGRTPGALRHRHGCACRSGATRRLARHPARISWSRVHPDAGVVAVPSGHRSKPRKPDRRVALRRVDHCLRPPARHGTPGGLTPHRRPHHGARFRPGHQRPSTLDCDGLHRLRNGDDGRWTGRRCRAGGLRLVGATPTARGLVRHTLVPS